MAAPKKDLNDLRRIAESQGWTVDETGSGHMKWQPPTGDYVMTSSTPTDQNIIKTIRKDLETAGLRVDAAAIKKLRKAVRDGTIEDGIEISALVIEEDDKVDLKRLYNPEVTSDDKIIEIIQRELPDLWDAVEFSSVRQQVAIRMIREWTPVLYNTGHDYPKICRTCERTYSDPLGLAMHIFHSEHNHEPLLPDTPDTEYMVDETDERPPADRRHDCPECPEWFWLSQAAEFDAHTRNEHHIGRCPYCDEFFPVRTGRNLLRDHMATCKPPELESEMTSVPLELEPEPEPEPEPAAPATAVPSLKHDATDDELFDLLEVVLDGPVMVTRTSLTAINEWMAATRRLLELKEIETRMKS